MATTSRQSALFGVQDWKRIYQTYREANFQSYDYETLRKSFIDYLTQYYPETFNDYIESSEFVALLDVIAFMGQALAFRGDLNARENFIDTAERRDSVIKLANLVSYTPKRNIAAQGLVKIVAVSTTENLTDINGVNLSNTTVLWNDPANANWQEQFNSVMNATFTNSQRIGRPGNTQTILGVKTDEYTMNIPDGQVPVVPFTSQIDGNNMNFELVSSTSLNSDSIYELPPAPSSQFNVLYRNDKLGYGSANTGWFFYFKQGSLQAVDFNFPEQIENNFQLINVQGVNNTDTWLYQLNNNGTIDFKWTQVDNIFVNPNLEGNNQRKIFTVTSRTNDQVTYVFGDGVFGEVPVGSFRAYVRSSNGLNYSISPSEMSGLVVNLNYISRSDRIETLTFTFDLQTTVNTAQQRESLADIKQRAPARYYTQNRMVNGEDYTNFPFTLYNSIVKSKAINRSSIGISRNQDLLDPTGKYSSTNVFGDDGALYVSDQSSNTSFSILSINLAIEFLSQTMPVYLAEPEVLQYYMEYYPRYSGFYAGANSIDGKCYWKRSYTSDNYVNGYFYILTTGNKELPIPLGAYSSFNMKYMTQGAQIKFVAPPGKYFDSNNRLQTGVPNPTNGGRPYIWVGIASVNGDGYNYGAGNLSDGSGPVTLTSYVPSGVYLDNTVGDWDPITKTGQSAIIPSFDNTIGVDLVKTIIDLIELKTSNFALAFDNSIPVSQERWILLTTIPTIVLPTTYMILFTYNVSTDSYSVTFRNRTYFFGSVKQVRFLFERDKKVFDQFTGKILRDYVNVLKTNANINYNPANPATGGPILGNNYILSITGQQIETDGYPNDTAVKVTSIDINTNVSFDPDFFNVITGIGGGRYVFFRVYSNITSAYVYELLAVNAVVYAYATKNAIDFVKYEYPEDTVFYATAEDRFYLSVAVQGATPPVLDLVDVTTDYAVSIGTNDIDFQYRHNSNNTTRIDPATTNIIDLYIVTQSYYNEYQNWLKDSTGTVPMPEKPTIDQLQQLYGNLEQYKMVSDTIIPNSVTFRPLFGNKAESVLQGTIKVVKSPTTTASNSQIRSSILSALNSYFTLDKWDFGDTFYASELSAYLHVELAGLISSVVLVPADPTQTFGDLYQIQSAPNEIFVNGATVNDITVVSSLTPQNLQQ